MDILQLGLHLLLLDLLGRNLSLQGRSFLPGIRYLRGQLLHLRLRRLQLLRARCELLAALLPAGLELALGGLVLLGALSQLSLALVGLRLCACLLRCQRLALGFLSLHLRLQLSFKPGQALDLSLAVVLGRFEGLNLAC